MDTRSVGELLEERAVVTVHRDASITEACMLMASEDVGALAVIDERGLCGIVTERDVVRRCDARGTPSQLVRVATIMSTDLRAIGPDATVEDACRVMSETGVQHVLVLGFDHELLGLLSLDALFLMRTSASLVAA